MVTSSCCSTSGSRATPWHSSPRDWTPPGCITGDDILTQSLFFTTSACRANPPGGACSDIFSTSADAGADTTRQKSSADTGAQRSSADQPGVSRFADEFEKQGLLTTTTQRIRTPAGLLRVGVPGENPEERQKRGRVPPGGESTGFW